MNKPSFYCLLAFFISSCSFYKPAKINAPFFHEKGEANIGGSIGRTADVNLSYSPIENVGLIANYSNGYNSTKKRRDSNDIQYNVYSYSNYQYEFGIGTYKHFESNLYLDAYAGYGFGQSASAVLDYSILFDKEGYKAKFDNYFFQCAIGMKDIESGLNAGLLFKYNHLNYYDFQGSFDAPPSPDYFDVDQTFVIQSNVVVNYCPELVGFEFQAGFNHAKREKYFSSRMINLMFGINVSIDQVFKKANHSDN